MGADRAVNAPCDIFCVGNVVADIVTCTVDDLPLPGTVRMVDRTALVLGGNAANTAAVAATLDLSARVAGAVGADNLGRFVRETLRARGVDDSALVTTELAPTSVTLSLVQSDGERCLLHVLGANGVFSEQDLDWQLVEEVRIFHYASPFLLPRWDGQPMLNALARAKRMGCLVSLDLAWDVHNRWVSLVGPALPGTDYLFPNLEEGRMLTGRRDPQAITRWLREHGVGTVVLKLGAGGCFVDGPQETFVMHGFEVDVHDTTGAGDCFTAAFLACLLEGATHREAAKFANAAAALSTLGDGGSDAAPTRAEAHSLMREQPVGSGLPGS